MQVFWKVNQSMHTSDQEYQEYLPCLLSQSRCPVKNKAKKKKFTISWIIHPFWLDLTFNLLEDRSTDYITMNKTLLPYNIIGFYVTVCPVSNRSQVTSKCGDTSVTHLAATWVPLFFFLSQFDICGLWLNCPTVKWNVFVKCPTWFSL